MHSWHRAPFLAGRGTIGRAGIMGIRAVRVRWTPGDGDGIRARVARDSRDRARCDAVWLFQKPGTARVRIHRHHDEGIDAV